ncbi:hypothetical protein B0T16DRAFT_393182 [Cercophora newfieldiana]|uniref:AA1-like domain-containing protein n=1 Tax=Cercophora newfieldiana TaxID=92897 RepID=A0AA39XWQ0_9PEZI|nr:hypothetical protein B0T16DRAFT_393182 [Cercophora newfieldiana]
MKFTSALALLSAVASAQVVIVPTGPVRGPNTLVFKEINGVKNNECLTFTNDGTIVNTACANANADRQVTPGKLLGADILIIQRSFLQPFRPDLVGKTACIGFNGTTFRAEDCAERSVLTTYFDVGNGRIVANGDGWPACLSGHDSKAIVTVDDTGRSCAQFTITAVTPTKP